MQDKILIFPNVFLSIFSFISCDYGDEFSKPVRTIEKNCIELVRETQFIHSAVKSDSQVLKVVR